MLAPKKVKFRKMQKGRMRGKAYRGGAITLGEFGLKALEPGWVTSRQIEAARIAITRFVKRGGQVWTRISLISLRDFFPKFLVFNISASVFCTKSAIVLILAFFRQLAARTDNSNSFTLR